MNPETYNKLKTALIEQRKRVMVDKNYRQQLLKDLGLWGICKNSSKKMKQKKNSEV